MSKCEPALYQKRPMPFARPTDFRKKQGDGRPSIFWPKPQHWMIIWGCRKYWLFPKPAYCDIFKIFFYWCIFNDYYFFFWFRRSPYYSYRPTLHISYIEYLRFRTPWHWQSSLYTSLKKTRQSRVGSMDYLLKASSNEQVNSFPSETCLNFVGTHHRGDVSPRVKSCHGNRQPNGSSRNKMDSAGEQTVYTLKVICLVGWFKRFLTFSISLI